MNSHFQRWWDAEHLDEELPKIILHPRLRALVHAPFVHDADRLLLAPLIPHATGSESFDDATGYEAFINKFHVDDLIEDDQRPGPELLSLLVRQGTKAALELAQRLTLKGRYHVFLSLDPELPTMTLRFYGVRKGEQWASDHLEGYQMEAVLIVDAVG